MTEQGTASWHDSAAHSGAPLLRVVDLAVHYPATSAPWGAAGRAVKAVDGVSFDLFRGRTLSIVGESGCGKTTCAMAVARLLQPTAGRILFDGQDITRLNAAGLRSVRRRMQIVFQDPFSSLNPRMKVSDIVGEPLVVHGLAKNRTSQQARVRELLELVGLSADMGGRFPHEFSGGQRQRISIARALALEPDLVICDEAVSALDVSVQAQILNLLMDLQARLGLAYLFISHDLSVVRHISDTVAVMYLGRIVELADRNALFDSPRHPYTQALLAAAPVADPEHRTTFVALKGEAPSARNPPPGCAFHPRCPRAVELCASSMPQLRSLEGRIVACHFADAAELSR